MRKARSFIFLFIFLCPLFIQAQIKSTGIPRIQQFLKSEYKAATQNWEIATDSRGFMYFANNDGLLEFDGAHWQIYDLPNQSIVRSLRIDANDRIYIGQQNAVGYMEPDENGRLQYHSLLDLIPESERNFEDIWRIHLTGIGVIFQSYTHLFVYKDDQINLIPLKNRIKFSFYTNGRFWIQDEKEGLKEYQQGKFFQVPVLDPLIGKEIWAMLPVSNNRYLIGTANDGVFIFNGETLIPWKNQANSFLTENQIFSALKFKNNYYAFGTIQNGLLITDEDGKIIQHLNKKKGLQNNTVLSMGTDHDENLWLGLDNGIDYVDIGSPFTYMYHSEGLGATYTSLVHNGKLYVGTNHGLFVKNWPEKGSLDTEDFRLISKTVGQVWYLGVHQNILLCGHNSGTFQIEGETARQISDIKGAWMFMDLNQNNKYLLGGNYNGMSIFTKSSDNRSWKLVGPVKGFNESSRLIAQDKKGNIWMSHGYKGVFCIRLNENLDSVQHYSFFNSTNGLPTDIYINLMKVDDKIIYTTPDGFYTYNETINRFEPSVYYNNLFDQQKNIDYLMQDQYFNIWYAAGTIPGVLRSQEDGTYTRVSAPFEELAGKTIAGFQHILSVDPVNTFIGMEDGLAHYSPSYQTNAGNQIRTYIREVVNIPNQQAFSPSSIQSVEEQIKHSFDFKANHFRFTYACPSYKHKNKIKFSFFLENYSTTWSEWSEEPNCEFMNLHEGDYSFKVKSIDPFFNESTIAQFDFTILPPWYRSILAYIIYAFMVSLVVSASIWFVFLRIRISRRKERLKHLLEYRRKVQQFQREALISEKEIIKLRNEQLHGKMIHLDKELANQTMNIIQKNKFFSKLKSEMKSIQNQITDSALKSKISIIVQRLDKELDDKRQKELFETYFDEVHEDFFRRLNEKYPGLTPREQKLCAYIKMNISSKEMAALLNISQRGVEISRYRLRKKLEIDRDTNLVSFIMGI